MIVPFWYLAIWFVTSCAYLAVCGVILQRRLLRAWPSVFFISLDRVVFFIAGQILRHDYPHYLNYYTADSLLKDVLYIWLAWDIARSIPSARLFPSSLKRWAWSLTLFAGAAVGIMTAPETSTETLASYRALYGASNAVFWSTAICLLLTAMLNGIGFSRTAFRITASALIRQLSSLVVSTIVARNIPRTVFRAANTADTLVSLVVAVSWAWTLSRALQYDRAQRLEWRAVINIGDSVHD